MTTTQLLRETVLAHRYDLRQYREALYQQRAYVEELAAGIANNLGDSSQEAISSIPGQLETHVKLLSDLITGTNKIMGDLGAYVRAL